MVKTIFKKIKISRMNPLCNNPLCENGKRSPKKIHKTKHDEINIKAHGTVYFIYHTSFIVLLQTCIENTLLVFFLISS